MTIPSTQRKAGPFSGDAVQTSWPFTFKVFAGSDVAVVVYTPLTGEVTLDPSEYTVTLNPNQDTSPGGTVTYPTSGAALNTTDRLTLVGGLPYDQPLDLPAGGNFSPAALENQLDRTVMQVQQLAEQQGRVLTLPATTGDVDPQFPSPDPSKFIAWNTDGTALRNVDGSDLSVEIAFSDWTFETFTGDGTTAAFSLQKPPGNIANMALSVDGLIMVPGVDFTLLANVITFTTAPALDAEILVRYGRNAEQLPVEILNAVQGPFLQLDNRVTYDFSITTGKNALAISPTIEAGVTVTVPVGSKFITLDEFAGGGGAEETLAANVGGGVPVYDSKDANTLNFRSLVAGDGIALASSAGGATTISSTVVPGETNDGANVGGGVPVYDGKTGTSLNFRSLVAGTGIGISSTSGGATTISSTVTPGEVNTGANIGTGTGTVYRDKAAAELRFKTLKAGANVTLTNNADDITIAAAASGGEVNTGTNIGFGAEVFAAKVGTELQFRRLTAGTGISITGTATTLTVNATGGSGETNTASNLGGGTGLYASKVGVDLRFKSLLAGTGMSLTSDASTATYGVNQAANFTWTGDHVWTHGTTPPAQIVDHRGFRIGYTTPADSYSPGYVKSGFVIEALASSGQTSFEWAQVVVLRNQAAAGENVAGYWRALKESTGPTWAGVMEVKDLVGGGTVYGLEIDVWSRPGATSYPNARFGIGFNFGVCDASGNRTGGTTTVDYGIDFSPDELDRARASLNYGLRFNIDSLTALISVGNSATTPVILDLVGSTGIQTLVSFASTCPMILFNPAAPTGHVGRIKIKVDGTTYYIPVTSD